MGYKAGGARGEQNPVPLGLLRSSPCSHAFCPLPRSTMSCVAELCPLPPVGGVAAAAVVPPTSWMLA